MRYHCGSLIALHAYVRKMPLPDYCLRLCCCSTQAIFPIMISDQYFYQLLVEYEDLRNIPYFKKAIEELTDEAVKLGMFMHQTHL